MCALLTELASCVYVCALLTELCVCVCVCALLTECVCVCVYPLIVVPPRGAWGVGNVCKLLSHCQLCVWRPDSALHVLS